MSATCSVPVQAPSALCRPARLSRRSGAIALFTRILAAGGLFLSHIVLMRSLGVSGFGEYSLAIAWLQILTGLAKLGLDNASLRYVPEYVTNAEFGKLRGFLHDSTRASLIAGAIVTTGVIVTALVFWSAFGNGLASCLIVGALMIPLITIRQIQEARLRGVGRLVESQVGTAIWPWLLFVLSGIVWQASPSRFSALSAVSLQLISLYTVSVMVYRFQRRIPFSDISTSSSEFCRRQWAKTALAFLVAELLISLKSRVCIALAGMMLDCPSAGLYGAMERFADASLLASQSLGVVIAPQFASLFADGRYLEMRRLLRYGQVLGLLFTFPIAIGIAIFGDQLFALLGSNYQAGWSVLVALLVTACVLAFSGPGAIVLQMTGRERKMLWITAASAITNLLLSVALLRTHGILGLGIAQIATSVVWAVGIQSSLRNHPAWRLTSGQTAMGCPDVAHEESL